MRTIAVVFGGNSNEREISVITGMLAANLLRGEFRVLPLYLHSNGQTLLCEGAKDVAQFGRENELRYPAVDFTYGGLYFCKKPKKKIKIDCVLNCCHGGMGEDGTLSAILEWYRIPNASPNTPVSAVFMNKTYGKAVALGLNIPVAPSVTLFEQEYLSCVEQCFSKAEELGYPVIVKPCRCGSSVGITVAENENELKQSLDLAFALDESALVEKYLPDKRDFNLAIYQVGGEIKFSPVEEVFSEGKILSFGEKYEGACKRTSRIPAEIPEEIERQMRDYLQTIYRFFDCKGVIRADFLISGEELYLNELNTVPGSLACYLFGESLSSAKNFLCELIAEGMRIKPQKRTITTGMLNSTLFTGAKACKRRTNRI